MNDRGVDLGEATRRGVERAERERLQAGAAGPLPRPGDLYALPATADHQVEWLVVAPGETSGERSAAEAGGGTSWVVLPADLSPVAGAADIEVPAEEPGGPLTVYGRFPVTVPGVLLAPDLRSGRIAEARREAAERRWREVAGGAEVPVREADHDPDYRRRLVELAAAQQALAAAAAEAARGGRAGGEPGGGAGSLAPVVAPARLARPAAPRFRPPPWMTALAAVLALAVIGLAAWNLRLLRQIDELSGARQVAMGPVLNVDDVTRGDDLSLPEAELVVLTLFWRSPPDPGERFRVSFSGPDGEELDAVHQVAPDRLGEAAIEVPRRVLARATVLRLVRIGERGQDEVVVEMPLRLERD